MSHQTSDTIDDVREALDEELDEYTPTVGAVESQIDISNDDHPVEQVLGEGDGEEGHRGFTSDSRVTGERFAFRYEDISAFLREYVANAQTACIRRARLELRQSDTNDYDDEWFDEHTIPEQLEEAELVADYQPLIEVHVAPDASDRDRVVVDDNGIGISIEEFAAMRRLGLSANHDDGTISGEFGQGIVSVFPAVSTYGEAYFVTKDRRTGLSYAERMTITGFDDMAGERDQFGTEWHIPAFGSDADDLDVIDKLDYYCQQMYVPVLVHEYDGNGSEIDQHEYTYEPLAEQIPDDYPVLTYEDDYVEAVASPGLTADDCPLDQTRYLISFPIEADDQGEYECPYPITYRLKREDGSIWQCTHDEDHTGLLPIEDIGYQRMDDDERADHVSKDDVTEASPDDVDLDGLPDDMDIVCPEPVDDRDRFRDHDTTFVRYLSVLLQRNFYQRASAQLQRFTDDGWDAVYDMTRGESELARKAVDMETARDPTAAEVTEALHSEYDWPRQIDTAGMMADAFTTVNLCDRLSQRPGSYRHQEVLTAWEIENLYGGAGDVYMAVNISTDKAMLAWHLDDANQVVEVDGTEDYSTLERFGWTPLKELSLYNVADKYDVDDEIAQELSKTRSTSDSSGDRDWDLNAPTRDVRVRQATDSFYHEYQAKVVKESLSTDGDGVRSVQDLLLFRETDVHGIRAGADATTENSPIGRAVVPNYVADYLSDAEHIHEVDEDNWEPVMADLRQEYGQEEITTIPLDQFLTIDNGVSLRRPDELTTESMPIGELVGEKDLSLDDQQTRLGDTTNTAGRHTLAIVVSPTLRERVYQDDDTPVDPVDRIAGVLDELRDWGEYSLFAFDRLALVTRARIDETAPAWGSEKVDGFADPSSSATPTVVTAVSRTPASSVSYTNAYRDLDLTISTLLPEPIFDRSSPEWQILVSDNKRAITKGRGKGEAALDVAYALAEQAGEDTAVWPSNRED